MEETFEDGENAFKEQNFDEAIQIFENCIQKADNEVKSNFFLGQCYFMKKDLENSEKYLKIAYQADKENFEFIYAYGMVLVQLKKCIDAYPILKKMIELNGNTMESQRGMAACYLGMKRYADAKTSIINAIYFNDSERGDSPPDKLCQNIYLIVLNELGLFKEVLDTIEEKELLYYFEDDIGIMREKIRALCELHQIDECIELARKFESDDNEMNYFIAKCLFYQGLEDEEQTKNEIEEIEEQLKKAKDEDEKIELNEQLKETLERLTDKFKEAREELTKAIKKKPNFEKSYLLNARILEKLHENDRKIRSSYLRCIKICPDCIDAYLLYTQFCFNYLDYKSAIRALDAASKFIDEKEQKPYELLYLLYRIECYCRLMRRKEAKGMLDYVRNTLRIETIRQSYTKIQMIEIFSKYFEIYHLCNYYHSNDLKINTEKVLGKGGFGTVYEGTLKKKEVAIKLFKFKEDFNKEIDYTYNSLESAFMEISAMELLSEKCEYILGLEVIFYENNRRDLMIVMPLMKGGNYLDLIKNQENVLSVKERVNILIQLAYAIKHFQSYNPPFIHHDIKSSNVLLVEQYKDNGNKIKLCDFGMIETKNKRGRGFTPSYAAPEFMREEPYSCPIDIFSFGVVCWESFARKIPFAGKNVNDIIEYVTTGERLSLIDLKDDCPKVIKDLIRDCFEEEPSTRPTINVIITELEKLL